MSTTVLSHSDRCRARLTAAWRLFAAFRRTRPFWGGLWLMLAGYVVIHFAGAPLATALGLGWGGTSGYILGGSMLLFGLMAWTSPHNSTMLGLLGVLAALAAFVAANLGGFLVGSVLGVLGGSMVWGWGEKREKREKGVARGRRAKVGESIR
ncbi:DUF6114 domain-containing protein [Nocardioides limicola]|uniref:DUF6114 domain-containing protein n=1 Tax=Nocardioides limicola TaxID=2803368 RepID=UPI001EEFD47E|nr:DUF6114 domain-containing protein [Nocardioides sp. DJM-14]